jgi:hypothetical protein
MAQQQTREIASFLRNGSLWVGNVAVSSGDLYFGDDRFDATHGLASFVCPEPPSSANEAAPQVHAWNRSADATAVGKTSSVPKSDEVVERLKRAA